MGLYGRADFRTALPSRPIMHDVLCATGYRRLDRFHQGELPAEARNRTPGHRLVFWFLNLHSLYPATTTSYCKLILTGQYLIQVTDDR